MIFTKKELFKLNKEIDFINNQLDLLDPDFDEDIFDAHEQRLEEIIKKLESSKKYALFKERGLRIIK